jgi:hypothetical protein
MVCGTETAAENCPNHCERARAGVLPTRYPRSGTGRGVEGIEVIVNYVVDKLT